jgi:FixJ family two-component response regulator
LPTFAKIFIIDDDVLVLESMKSLIQSLGYDTETFGSAEDYLNCSHILDPACLITDVQMPGMTGFDLLSRLLSEGYSIPVIFMSAHPGEALRAAAIEAGTVGFLDKPVNVGDLIDCLNNALKSHSS